MSTASPSSRLQLIVAASIAVLAATACGGGRRSSAPPAPTPEPAVTTPPPAAGLATGAQAGTPTASAVPLWRISEPACPASDTAGGTGATPGDTTRADTTARATRSGDQTRKPAIILRASVAARELRFASQPDIVVRLCGGTLDSVRVVERRNLPTPVVAGTTYRDIYVAIEILGHLDAACIASALTGGGTGKRGGPCGSLAFSDSAGRSRIAPTPP